MVFPYCCPLQQIRHSFQNDAQCVYPFKSFSGTFSFFLPLSMNVNAKDSGITNWWPLPLSSFFLAALTACRERQLDHEKVRVCVRALPMGTCAGKRAHDKGLAWRAVPKCSTFLLRHSLFYALLLAAIQRCCFLHALRIEEREKVSEKEKNQEKVSPFTKSSILVFQSLSVPPRLGMREKDSCERTCEGKSEGKKIEFSLSLPPSLPLSLILL